MLKTVGNPSTRYGDQTVVDGNIVIGTAGKGIDFSAAGGDVFKDYDEGTWTPTVGNLVNITSVTISKATFTKIGRQVTINVTGTMAVTAPAILASMSVTLPENQGDLSDPSTGVAQFDYVGIGAAVDYTGATGNTAYVFFPASVVLSGTRYFSFSMTYNAT